MAFQIVLNLIIAFVWMFLNNAWNGVGFLIGYLLGLLLIGDAQILPPTLLCCASLGHLQTDYSAIQGTGASQH